jgi:hypothetical protein
MVLGQGPGAATDVKHLLSCSKLSQLDELHSERLGEPAHEPAVRVRRDVEAHPPDPTRR